MGEPKVLPLKPGRDKSVLRRHPGCSGAVARRGRTPPRRPVDVRGAGGASRRGYYNPASNIVVRLLTWDEEEVCPAFWRWRLAAAIARRERLAADLATTAYRWCTRNPTASWAHRGLAGEWLVSPVLTLGWTRSRDARRGARRGLPRPGDLRAARCGRPRPGGLDPAPGFFTGRRPSGSEILENGLRYPSTCARATRRRLPRPARNRRAAPTARAPRC